MATNQFAPYQARAGVFTTSRFAIHQPVRADKYGCRHLPFYAVPHMPVDFCRRVPRTKPNVPYLLPLFCISYVAGHYSAPGLHAAGDAVAGVLYCRLPFLPRFALPSSLLCTGRTCLPSRLPPFGVTATRRVLTTHSPPAAAPHLCCAAVAVTYAGGQATMGRSATCYLAG